MRGSPRFGSSASRYQIRGPLLFINVEADSLNSAVLGPDVEVGSDAWHLFVRHVVTEVTQKTGQKCTATRRVFVQKARIDDVQAARAVQGD